MHRLQANRRFNATDADQTLVQHNQSEDAENDDAQEINPVKQPGGQIPGFIDIGIVVGHSGLHKASS
jgi:hypothetical protein